jgi:hypothetical protein
MLSEATHLCDVVEEAYEVIVHTRHLTKAFPQTAVCPEAFAVLLGLELLHCISHGLLPSALCSHLYPQLLTLCTGLGYLNTTGRTVNICLDRGGLPVGGNTQLIRT